MVVQCCSLRCRLCRARPADNPDGGPQPNCTRRAPTTTARTWTWTRSSSSARARYAVPSHPGVWRRLYARCRMVTHAGGPQLQVDKRNVKALQLRAETYLKKKAFARSIDDYNTILEMLPNVRRGYGSWLGVVPALALTWRAAAGRQCPVQPRRGVRQAWVYQRGALWRGRVGSMVAHPVAPRGCARC